MYISFDQLPPDARVWIYQADRAFTTEEEAGINPALASFCAEWAVHGQPLNASFVVAYHRFVILAVDEAAAQASGCSIDSSVRVVKALGTRLGIDFFDRLKIALLVDDAVKTFSKKEVEAAFQAGTISKNTVAFNNLVATKSEFENNWQVALENSWLAKYLSPAALSA